MRLILSCHECLTTGRLGGAFAIAEYRDDDQYETVCPAGHKSITVLQQQRFELLFEMGAYAILDGYYREAVSAFAGSLERFFEFAIRVLLLESSGSDDLFQTAWKDISSQSERQLGAFSILWASRFGARPPLLPNKSSQFRNDVIHRGRIPSKDEAVGFGDSILERLTTMIDQLESECAEQIIHVTFLHIREATPKNLPKPAGTLGATSIVCLAIDKSEREVLPLTAHLDRLDERRRTLADFLKRVS